MALGPPSLEIPRSSYDFSDASESVSYGADLGELASL